ncbi:hypothetical protein EDD15DRAFT_545078 [Pisolithus albus]|nr:hypothetical protein EDD15DRAFT_545078 [Pisolithus albus]
MLVNASSSPIRVFHPRVSAATGVLTECIGYMRRHNTGRFGWPGWWEGNDGSVQSGIEKCLYDSILLTRLFALYPISTTPATTLLKIFAFPFCVKCTRVVVLSIGLNKYVSPELTTVTLEEDEATAWFRNPKMTTEWGMQIADNLYSIGIFLYNLHVHTPFFKRAGGVAARIRQIFYISLANFVFPLIFNIAQIICVATDRAPTTATTLLMICNRHSCVVRDTGYPGRSGFDS